MPVSSGPRRGWLGLLLIVGAGLGFALFAPIGLLTLPLVALMVLSQPAPRGFSLAIILAGGISIWWLAELGEPPDQVARAAALVGTAVFGATLVYTNWSLIHRALVAVAAAASAVIGFVIVLPTSWSEIRWWVESRIGFAAQILLSTLDSNNVTDTGVTASDPLVLQLEDWLEVAVPLMADFFPATLAIQMLAGFALASLLCHRLAQPTHRTVGRFRDFRFSEHLGWAAVVALAIILLTRFVTVKLLAANVLIVAGVLYALRGAAVVWFALAMAGGPGFFSTAVIVLSIVFLLPVVLTGTILLGVVDAGLDLRQRWSTQRART